MATITPRKRKGGGVSWRVRIKYTRDGVQHIESKTFSDRIYKRRDVETWARNREHEIDNAQTFSKAAASITLGDLVHRYLEEFEGSSEWGKTKANDLRHLATYSISSRPAVQLKAQDFIEHIRDRRGAGVSASTANNDLVWWAVVYKVAIGAWDMPLKLDPIESAKTVCRQHNLIARSSQRDRRPSLAELELLLDHTSSADGRLLSPMTDIILFQIFSARRIAETCRITWADLDESRSTVIVRDMKDPRKRRGNDIEVVLPAQALKIVQRQPRTDERIFPYNSKSIGSYFTKKVKLLGIQDLTLHDLRHEGTSWLFETGLDIPRVAKVTGHRSWACLQRYSHLEGIEPFDKYQGWKWLRSNRPARLEIVG